MEEITLANVLSTYRERFGLRQQDIYRGICSGATYQSVELHMPDVEFVYLESLLARVGQDTSFFECVLDEEAYAVWVDRTAIRVAMVGRKYEEAERRLEYYRKIYLEQHILHEQFCLYYEMKLAWYRNASMEIVCELAKEALLISKEIGDMPHPQQNLYTPMEMDLLLTLVQYRYGIWDDFKKRKEVLLKILDYIAIYYNQKTREEIEIRTWMELLEVEEQYGDLQQLPEYIDKALVCLEGSTSLLPVAELRFRKARLLHSIALTADNREEVEEQCHRECRIAYAVYGALGRVQEQEKIKAFCEGELEWHITTPMKWFD